MAGNLELPIRIKIQPGVRVAIVLIVIHSGAITGLIYTELPVLVKFLIASLVLVNLVHLFFVYILQIAGSSPAGLYLDSHDEWWLTYKNGETHKVRLLSGSFVHPLLIILRFNQGLDSPVVILTPDVTNPDSLRRLRVRLRFRKG